MKQNSLKIVLAVTLVMVISIICISSPYLLALLQNKQISVVKKSYDTTSVTTVKKDIDVNTKFRMIAGMVRLYSGGLSEPDLSDNIGAGPSFASYSSLFKLSANKNAPTSNDLSMNEAVQAVTIEYNKLADLLICPKMDFTKNSLMTIKSKFLTIDNIEDKAEQVSLWQICFFISDVSFFDFLIDSQTGQIYNMCIYGDSFVPKNENMADEMVNSTIRSFADYLNIELSDSEKIDTSWISEIAGTRMTAFKKAEGIDIGFYLRYDSSDVPQYILGFTYL